MLAGVALDPDQNSGQGDKDPMATRTDRKLAKESGVSIKGKATYEKKRGPSFNFRRPLSSATKSTRI